MAGNPLCPDPALLDLLPEEAEEYVELGIAIGFQVAFEALIGSVEARMEDEDTGPARHVFPRAMRLDQIGKPDEPTFANSLGFQRGLTVYLADPGGGDLDTVEFAWVEGIPEYATTVRLEVNENLDIGPYLDARAVTVSEPVLRTCAREDVTYVTISTVAVEL